ncbi:MRC1L-E protein, partial [Aphelenchoides avenae]
VIDYQNGYTWTWSGAQYECNHNNASLVSVPDLATNFDILRYARDASIGYAGPVAIGLSYNRTDSAWTWSDGSRPTFTNWAPGYPRWDDDENPYYAYMWLDGNSASLWRNYPFNMALDGIICQRPPGK